MRFKQGLKQWFTLHGKFRFRRRVGALLLAGAFVLALTGAWGSGSLATWYALWGNYTFCGDMVTAEDWTAAHPAAGSPSMPCGQKITVCYTNGCARGVVITDRGPAAWTGKELDLNKPVADRIGLTADGVGAVEWWTTGYEPNYAYK